MIAPPRPSHGAPFAHPAGVQKKRGECDEGQHTRGAEPTLATITHPSGMETTPPIDSPPTPFPFIPLAVSWPRPGYGWPVWGGGRFDARNCVLTCHLCR